MDIYEALRQIPNKKALYFKWKFNLQWDQTKKPKTEKEFLKTVGVQSINTYKAWEKTDEYRQLVAILLETRFDHDLQELYDSLSQKAKKTGNEKDIKLLLQLGKEIKGYAKEAQKQFGKAKVKVEDQDEDDNLILG